MPALLKSLERFCVDRPVVKHHVKRLRYLGIRLLCWPSGPGRDRSPKILGYHTVGEGDDDLSLSTAAFQRHIAWLQRHGYRIVTLRQYWSMTQTHRTAPDRCVVLTFDDGFRQTLRCAAPVLTAKGLAATVFLTTDFIGGTNTYDRPLGVRELSLLSWGEVRELKRLGWDIQSHGRRHYPLVGLARDVLNEELAGSKAIIEERVGDRVDFFCYPYGAFDAHVPQALAEAGYLGAVTCWPGTLGHPAEIDAYRLPRLLVDGVMAPADFAAYFSPGYRWLNTFMAWSRQRRGTHLASPFNELDKLAPRELAT